MIRILTMFAVFSLLAAAQQTGQQASDAKSKTASASKTQQADQPAPLFDGQLSVHSSKTTKESATMGFNGIDPSGKVEKKMLAAQPTTANLVQVQSMSALQPKPAELSAFRKAGGLKAK